MQLIAIFILLAVIGLVLNRLPKVDLGYSNRFRYRRLANWLPLGLTYAFLYMGRYNINVAKNTGIWTKEELGIITFWGALIYGCSFIINGPLTDRYGGRRTIIIAALGSGAMNLLMGLAIATGVAGEHTKLVFSVLYAANMYFQSFGAVSIVKVNAHWFHVLERGTFGGIFGILISLGIYFAYNGGGMIVDHLPTEWVFLMPAIILAAFAVIDYFLVFDQPSDTGHADFDTADASSGDDGKRLPVWEVAKRMARNPIVVTIALVELCSGFVRGSIMKWTYVFLSDTGQGESFAYVNWGMLMCVAGILGGVFAGTVSDRLFQSRRGPSAAILYGFVCIGLTGAAFVVGSPAAAYVLVFAIMSIIGVHGMLSGTASMDFGGRNNVGVAVGLIDGMVYMGFAVQANLFGHILPTGEAQADPANWWTLPVVNLPVAAIGLLLALRIWHALPDAARNDPRFGRCEFLERVLERGDHALPDQHIVDDFRNHHIRAGRQIGADDEVGRPGPRGTGGHLAVEARRPGTVDLGRRLAVGPADAGAGGDHHLGIGGSVHDLERPVLEYRGPVGAGHHDPAIGRHRHVAQPGAFVGGLHCGGDAGVDRRHGAVGHQRSTGGAHVDRDHVVQRGGDAAIDAGQRRIDGHHVARGSVDHRHRGVVLVDVEADRWGGDGDPGGHRAGGGIDLDDIARGFARHPHAGCARAQLGHDVGFEVGHRDPCDDHRDRRHRRGQSAGDAHGVECTHPA